MNGDGQKCPPHDLMLLRTERRVERKGAHTRKADLAGRDVMICQRCGKWKVV